MPTLDPNWVTGIATAVLALVTGVYVRELRDGHERALEPLVHWQDPLVTITPLREPGLVRQRCVFAVVNYGAGHARLTEWTVDDDTGEQYQLMDDEGVVPVAKGHTLPPGVIYKWSVEVPVAEASLRGATRVKVTLFYADVEGRHRYSSAASFSLLGSIRPGGHRSFQERDERPARERRLRPQKRGIGRLWPF